MTRILMILALIFCFGCSDDDNTADAAVDASVQEAAVEASVQPEASVEASVDAQPADVGEGEAVASDAQSE